MNNPFVVELLVYWAKSGNMAKKEKQKEAWLLFRSLKLPTSRILGWRSSQLSYNFYWYLYYEKNHEPSTGDMNISMVKYSLSPVLGSCCGSHCPPSYSREGGGYHSSARKAKEKGRNYTKSPVGNFPPYLVPCFLLHCSPILRGYFFDGDER